MSESGAPIRIEDLVKVFGQVHAVDGISLSISAGQFLTLLGPSGSGKTTTLNLIAGFEIPTTGRILVGEEDIATKPPHKRNLGMVFQNYALFPHMTVFDNVSFPLRNRGVARRSIEERVKEVLSLVQLSGYEERKPNQLSGGQQQRVALARALVYRPQALLMDEPLGALDKNLREYMQLEIKRIQRETCVTVISVTHDQEEALNMSDIIAVMNTGRIEQIGSPRDIYEKPNNQFVANFIGGDANILDGYLLKCEDRIAVVKMFDGFNTRASNPHKKSEGTSVKVMIRPERIRLLAEHNQMENCFAGHIYEASFVGDIIRYRVHIVSGERITIKEHNIGQQINIIGKKVSVGWNAEDALVV